MQAIPEIFLTRLLSTKGTVQKFVDDFFGTILKVPPSFPAPVKWLFDTLDEAGEEFSLASPEVGTHPLDNWTEMQYFLSRFAITGQLYAENGFNNL